MGERIHLGDLRVTGALKEPWVPVSAAHAAQDGQALAVDTSGGAFTVTLPTTPTPGVAIKFMDAGGAFDTNPLTIAPDAGQTIMGLAESMTVNTNNLSFMLVPLGDDWRLA